MFFVFFVVSVVENGLAVAAASGRFQQSFPAPTPQTAYDRPMTTLSDTELRVLRNLAAKRAGNLTPFINIADAQRLTAQGLAARSRQGWEITPEGLAFLATLDGAPDNDPDQPTPLFGRNPPDDGSSA